MAPAAAALRLAAVATCLLAGLFSFETKLVSAADKKEAAPVAAPAVPSDVKVLTDSNFEVETQAASGHTSGAKASLLAAS